jgi:Tfp pilus assembly protein FimT
MKAAAHLRRVEGVALLDVLIGAVILGILAMVAVPYMSSMVAASRLSASATEMVSGLQYAGSLAARYHRPFGLKADTAANSFSVYDSSPSGDPPVDGSNTVLNPVEKTWYAKDFDNIDAYKGVKIVSVPAGSTVLFYPDGHTGFSDSLFTLAYGTKQMTITVSSTTGRIKVQ